MSVSALDQCSALAGHFGEIVRKMFDRNCTAEDFVLHYDNALAHLNDLTDVLDEVTRFGLHFVTWLKAIGLSSH